MDATGGDRRHDGGSNGTSELPPQEIDRVFAVMEEAVDGGALEDRQLDRFLSVLERAVAGPSETNPETVAELVSLLERFVVQPADLDGVDVDGMLSLLEEVITGTTGADPEHLHDAFDVLEAGLRDPTGIDPDDVEQLRAGLEGAIADATESAPGGMGWLLSPASLDGGDLSAEDDDALEAFRIARVAAALTQRATGYSLESGIRTGTRMAYAAANAESPARLLTETRAIALDELQRAGVDIGEDRTDWLEAHEEDLIDRRPMSASELRRRGERLLDRSAEVGSEETFHPAYPFVLEELATDEARILRLLATDGEQPTVDVRDREFVPFRSHPVAERLTKVGSDAGCRRPDRTPIYLQNLERLGLVAFADDPVDDLKRYQVLEAQPHIERARASARRPKTVYGRVSLTDFGVDFCAVCMPFAVDFERPATRFRRSADE